MYKFNEADKAEFLRVLAVLGETYDKGITGGLVAAYELALHDVPIASVKAMAFHHMRTEKWFPRPCELIPKASYRVAWMNKLIAGRNRSLEDERARLAWQQSPPMKIEYKPAGDVLSDSSGQE